VGENEKKEYALKILSLNCNGIRSATEKGLNSFISKNSFDLIAYQEIKALEKDIDISFYKNLGYESYIFPAEKKGYSGTAIFSKIPKDNIKLGIDDSLFDKEGRVITLDTKNITFINAYFPSGTSGEERQSIKMIFLDKIFTYINQLKKNKKVILMGDINIAHTEIDIHDPKGNKKSSGFLPEEREWIDKLLQNNWVDGFRVVSPNLKDIYSWWTYRTNARAKNKGWRIDSFFLTENLKNQIKDCGIYMDLVFSDHAPIYLELE
jgi:exodeoxyribonuclease-3